MWFKHKKTVVNLDKVTDITLKDSKSSKTMIIYQDGGSQIEIVFDTSEEREESWNKLTSRLDIL